MLAPPCATIRAMTRRGDPLEGIERVLIDGNNLLGALRRTPAAAPLPTAALIAPMVLVPCHDPAPLCVGLARESRAQTSNATMKAASTSDCVAFSFSASGSSAGITGAISWPWV